MRHVRCKEKQACLPARILPVPMFRRFSGDSRLVIILRDVNQGFVLSCPVPQPTPNPAEQ